MRATEITMQIVKNIGNYETIRLQATYELLPTDDIEESFITAKFELEASFKEAYKDELLAPKTKISKVELVTGTSEFIRVCKALKNGQTSFEELQLHFIITRDALNYLTENKLL